MEALRSVMRRSLARSLEELSSEDRLHAAWPLVCGSALASHAEVRHLDPEGVLHVCVKDADWRERFFEIRPQITADLGRVAGVRLAGIHFEKPVRRVPGRRRAEEPNPLLPAAVTKRGASAARSGKSAVAARSRRQGEKGEVK